MGVRFRKTVTICKGVKMNVSKSGVSLTLGGNGHSVNIGGKGVTATAGIPGTGLSYSKKLTPSLKSLAKKATKKDEKADSKKENAKVKAEEAKQQKLALEEQRQKEADEAIQAAAEANEKFLTIHTFAPIVESKEEFEKHAKRASAEKKAMICALLEGEYDAVCDSFDQWIGSIELPVEIHVNYEWDCDNSTMLLDVDMPEIEDLPDNVLTKTATGILKEKKKTQTEKREEYATCVFGLAVFLTANAFNISPAIEKVLISAYTQRRDNNGDVNDDYIYSLKFTRDVFEGVDVAESDPEKICDSVPGRFSKTSTSLFKKIKPFESFE